MTRPAITRAPAVTAAVTPRGIRRVARGRPSDFGADCWLPSMAAISRARDLARRSGPGGACSAQKSSISFISSTGSLSLGFAGVQILKFRADLAPGPGQPRGHRPERDADRLSNLLAAQPAGHQEQHVALPPGQAAKG